MKFRMILYGEGGQWFYVESEDAIEFAKLVAEINLNPEACFCFG